MKFVETRVGKIKTWVVDSWAAVGVVHGFMGNGFDARDVSNLHLATEWDRDEIKVRFLKQCHGSEIITASGELSESSVGDGWFVEGKGPESRGSVFAIVTADCAPVIIRSPSSDLFAILHCGWRGTVAGLLQKAIAKFASVLGEVSELEIAIGPAAQSCCYEVGEEFLQLVAETTLIRRNGKLFFSLSELLLKQALDAGVKVENIAISPSCTICSSDFFSYRREKSFSGRQLSYVGVPG